MGPRAVASARNGHSSASIPCRAHRPRGEAVDNVRLRTVLPQAQKDTSQATAARCLHDGSSPLKRAQQHKSRMLSCGSLASSI